MKGAHEDVLTDNITLYSRLYSLLSHWSSRLPVTTSARSNYQSTRNKNLKINIGSQVELEKNMCAMFRVPC